MQQMERAKEEHGVNQLVAQKWISIIRCLKFMLFLNGDYKKIFFLQMLRTDQRSKIQKVVVSVKKKCRKLLEKKKDFMGRLLRSYFKFKLTAFLMTSSIDNIVLKSGLCLFFSKILVSKVEAYHQKYLKII